MSKKIVFLLSFLLYTFNLFASWTDDQVRDELATNKVAIEAMRCEIGGAQFSLPIAVAKWASTKARSTADLEIQQKYALLAREILNEAKGFNWQNFKLASKEWACIASISIDIALATADSEESLWNGLPHSTGIPGFSYYNHLKNTTKAGRYIGAKIAQSSLTGLIAWARMPGIRSFLVEAIETTKPENIASFFVPNSSLVRVTSDEIMSNWKADEEKLPDTWNVTEDAKERLLIADGIIRAQNPAWPIRSSTISLTDIRNAYNELNRLGTAVSVDLLSLSDSDKIMQQLLIADGTIRAQNPAWPIRSSVLISLVDIRNVYNELNRLRPFASADLLSLSDTMLDAVARGYSPAKITKLIPLFLLLNPMNFITPFPQDGFDAARFMIGNIPIESPTAHWSIKASLPEFNKDFSMITQLFDQMDSLIKEGGFGYQGVHKLDTFRAAHTKEIQELGGKYFAEHYAARRTKEELVTSIDTRLSVLGDELTAHYDGRILTKEEILMHLRYVLNGYPAGFTAPLASTPQEETEWLEILSMIFDFSQKLDTFRLNTGIDATPYNLESNFYSQLYENQFTGGGCVPGRKNRILYRLANLLRQWMMFGYQLA